MRLCIVGAGLAGLCAARHALQNNMDVIVFEQSNHIGGTWVYSEMTGKNEYDIETHGSMYQGLRTNLPKEIMGFPDFPFPDQNKSSYIHSQEVLEFLYSYADKFKLFKVIKFEHCVLRVIPKKHHWEVTIKELPINEVRTYTFDCVMICNGHFQTPLLPDILGNDNFRGKQLHSHKYRKPEMFTGKKVLIIGSGPSALDICLQLNNVAEELTISHHLTTVKINLPTNIIQKSDVCEIYKNHVKFIDNSIQEFDIIIYCTGYQYSFPFLSMDSGIYIENNSVQPLYKHCINIKNPTLAFIGLINEGALSYVIDLQIRFVLSYFLGKNQLPTTSEMYADKNLMEQNSNSLTIINNKYHNLGTELQEKYCNDLSELANIVNIPPVIFQLYHIASCKVFLEDIMNYRNKNFKIINNDKFIILN